MKLLTGINWNNGDLTKNPEKMKRVHVTHQEKVNTSADKVFCLASQATANLWVDKQRTGLDYSESGKNENNALWADSVSGNILFQSPGLKTYWYTTLYDTENYQFHAVLANPDLAVGKYEFEVADTPDGSSLLRFDFTYTALNAEGNRLFDKGFKGRMFNMIKSIGDSIVQRLKSGLELSGISNAAPGEGVPNIFKAERAQVHHEVTVKGDVDDCFSLLCPVAELKWIDEWQFDLIYSESGRNEKNNIILEPSSGLAVLHSPGLKTYWYTTVFDSENHRCHFVLLSQSLVVAKLEIKVDDLADGNALIKWDLTYTGLSQEGNKMIQEKDIKNRMFNMLNFLGLSAKHYIETGKIYRVSKKRKLDLMMSITSAKVKRHFQQSCSGIRAKSSFA